MNELNEYRTKSCIQSSVIFRLLRPIRRPTQLLDVGDVVRRDPPPPPPPLLPRLDLVHRDDRQFDAGVALEEGRQVLLRHLGRSPQVPAAIPEERFSEHFHRASQLVFTHFLRLLV